MWRKKFKAQASREKKKADESTKSACNQLHFHKGKKVGGGLRTEGVRRDWFSRKFEEHPKTEGRGVVRYQKIHRGEKKKCAWVTGEPCDGKTKGNALAFHKGHPGGGHQKNRPLTQSARKHRKNNRGERQRPETKRRSSSFKNDPGGYRRRAQTCPRAGQKGDRGGGKGENSEREI